MADPPAVNTLLHIVVSDDVSFQSRVQDVDGLMLAVAAPIGKGDVEIPPDGHQVEVFWTGNRTRFMLVAEMAGWTKERPPRWYLRIIREPMRQTRRRYVRGGGGGPVSIRAAGAKGRDPHRGWMIDVSEAGVRCRMLDTANELVAGSDVVVEMTVGDSVVELKGTVLLMRSDGTDTGRDVVVVYDPPERAAQIIRQHVLQWEIAQRRFGCELGQRTVVV